MKIVLESSETKENDKKKIQFFFSKFWGVSAPPKTPQKPKNRGFKGAETPQNFEKIFFFKTFSFSLGSKLSRTIFIFDFQFQEVF